MSWRIKKDLSKFSYILGSSLFFLLTTLLLLHQTSLYFVFSLAFCLITLGYFLSLSNLKNSYFALALLLPLSLKLNLDSLGFDFTFPSELMVALLAIALVFKWLLQGYSAKEFLKSSFSLLVVTYLLFSIGSAIFSTMPWVSLKAVLVRITYVIVFYFGVGDVFSNASSKSNQLFLNYGYSLFLITLYCLYFQSIYNWDKQTAAFSVNPFYSDHTIFSTCAAFILPSFFRNAQNTLRENDWILSKIWKWSLVIIFLLGLYFTYCRAAWISLFFIFLFSLSLKMGFKSKQYLLLLLFFVILAISNRDALFFSFKENKNVSTAPNTNAIEQTQSITNVSTDVSNAERLNRWSCAWRMFLDKPITGFGPGTYQFQYLPYQLPDEITYISVFSPYNIEQGRGGSTHNEYLLLLSECGLATFLIFIFLLLKLLYSSLIKICSTAYIMNKQSILWALLGLLTYLVHAFFNNFLDTDKAAFLFWASISILVSWNIGNKKTASIS